MRILHIIDHLGIGGAQMIVKGIMSYKRCSHEHHLYSLRRNDYNPMELDHDNVMISDSYSKYSLSPIPNILKLVKERRIDILHCHLTRSILVGYLTDMLAQRRIRLIVHEHGKVLDRDGYRNVLRLVRRRADIFIAVSKTIMSALEGEAGIRPRKMRLLENFIRIRDFSITRNSGMFTIGFIGRFTEVKGCRYLLQALDRLEFPYRCIVIGDGPLRGELMSMVKDNPRVEFLGYVSDVRKVYRRFDVMVVPSLRESFGITVLEAWASGVPVICSDIMGLRERVRHRHNGLLFRKGDPKDLAGALNLLHDDRKLRESIADHALGDVRRYDISNYMQRLDGIYEVIGAGR
jgi:glycosyltransferase involved in cell wall biosynthesis